MIEPDYVFTCPYCSTGMSVRLDVSGGKRQSFIYDCETCCSPIEIQVEFNGAEVVSFTAHSHS
ncbi:MAG: CPXCG motif-containing cysteine-rich protein [Candidatus Omnitrophica bacterium CG11_big_fil_rev_8_21_14_0_20_45_26]|uniref:CPXCG motif-containing cysteine-rich protein n=1 Tax=Candidatus Abzuiibacterium crystallinum TaxID=1974748 RepID=A0A2H0LQH7_9BACT|nr:MAG: CPXCG motif-containing cysteine-rich protein [Candidatus Omnitrophica bacterium CG11_big_fil_rev_8_21_14_0_20_45_26]PIW64382.1 MAG: CPXCG motif-containing cysteine-rich protein [Candidatus Omnitrophica bacterium CG12_big_fil_rev_8_21_14_0_65_45_16]